MKGSKAGTLQTTGTRAAVLLALAGLLILSGIAPVQAQAKSSLKIGVPLNYPDFSFQDDPESLVQGYSVDVLHILCRNMSVAPRFLVGLTEDLLYALAHDDLDMVCGVGPGSEASSDFTYLEVSIYTKRYTFSHVPANKAKVRLPATPKTVVMVGGTDYVEHRLLTPKVNLLRARTVKEALFLVNSGTAQEYVGYSDRLATYLIGEHDLQNVRQTGVTMSRFPLILLTNKDHPGLGADLRLALGTAIQSGELEKVREKWVEERELSYFFESYGLLLLSGTALLVVLITGVTIWNQALKRKVNEITGELQASEERYRQLIESSPDFVFLINQGGLLRLANQSVGRRLGISREDLPRMSLFELVPREDHERCQGFIQEVFSEGLASVEMRMKGRRGDPISLEIAAALLRKDKDEARLACCFARDLTVRKRMESELIKSDRLATLGRMAAGLAHEVNNPLGIISAHTGDLLSGELNPRETAESLAIIQRNAIRAGSIIEALLGQASSRPPRMVDLDLAEIIEGCLLFLRPRMKKIKLETETAPGRHWIKGDEAQLQQVLVNLLLNSAENVFENGLIRVWIQDGSGPDQAFHHLWIEDNGRGITPEDRDRVFDPFFSKNKDNGVGLGLFVSERIINRHGGTIRAADSSLGGAAMVVGLPALAEHKR